MNKSTAFWENFPQGGGFLVKGISKQVIVVNSPDKELFDQAIFILKDEAVKQGVTEDLLLKEAHRAINEPKKKRQLRYYGPV